MLIQIVLFVLAVILPIYLWYKYIRYEDRSEAEPERLVRRCLYVGIAAAVMAAFVELFNDFVLDANIHTSASLVGAAGFAALLSFFSSWTDRRTIQAHSPAL